MKYVILGFDGPQGQEQRKRYRDRHLAHLENLDAAGRVFLAGPLTDQSGSLIIIEADSLDQARALAEADPYIIHGVFERIEVHPFEPVFPRAND